MKNKTKTAQLVLGAVLLALFVVLHIIVPGGNRAIQGMLMIVTCLPITFYILYSGKTYSILILAAGTALCAVLLHPLVLFSFAIPGLVIGVVFGLIARRVKRPVCIGILAALHFLQNILELVLYFVLMNVSLLDSFSATIDRLMNMVGMLTQDPAILSFVNDVILCAIPVAMVVGALAKGVLTYLILKVLLEKLSGYLGIQPLSEESAVLNFNSSVISIICLVWNVIYCAVAGKVYFGLFGYGMWFAAYTALTVVLCGAYLYYIYLTRIRLGGLPGEKQLLYTGLLVVLLPVNMIAVPILELCRNRKERKTNS